MEITMMRVARLIRGWLLAFALVALASPTWAQGARSATLTSTTCPGDGCLVLGVEGFGSAAVQLIVSGTSTTVVEGSIDGRNFRSMAASATDGSGNVTSMTATGAWFVNVGGLTQVRVRVSSYSSGSVTALLQATRSGGGASGGGGDATAANQSTQITSLQLIDDLPVGQGSTTSGQSGVLTQGAVTTSAPTYTNGQTAPLSLATDGSLRVSGGGGGTQYTNGSAQATPTGTVALGYDGTNVLALSTNASGQLNVVFPSAQAVSQSGTWNITNVSGTVSLPTGAATSANQSTEITSLQLIDNIVSVDDAAGTAGTTSGTPIMGFATSDTVDAGDVGIVKMSTARTLYVTLANSSGTELTPSSDVTEDSAETANGTGPMVLSVRRDAAASSAGASGDNSTFNTDANGLLWSRHLDPCTALAKTTVAVSATADTVLIAASASNRNYICGGVLVAGAAEVVSIWDGTGTVCGTGSTALVGSTTEANGVSLAANGGFIIPDTIRNSATNVDSCLRISGANRVSGYITYVQAP